MLSIAGEFILAAACQQIYVMFAHQERKPIAIVQVRQVMDGRVIIAVIVEIVISDKFQIKEAAQSYRTVKAIRAAEVRINCDKPADACTASDNRYGTVALSKYLRHEFFGDEVIIIEESFRFFFVRDRVRKPSGLVNTGHCEYSALAFIQEVFESLNRIVFFVYIWGIGQSREHQQHESVMTVNRYFDLFLQMLAIHFKSIYLHATVLCNVS